MGAVTELFAENRVVAGDVNRVTLFRMFLVDLNAAGTENNQVTADNAPYVTGIPQLGTQPDFSDAATWKLGINVPIQTFNLTMVGYQTFLTSSPNHVKVRVEYDNFTIGRFQDITVQLTTETVPVYRREVYAQDFGNLQGVRYTWAIHEMNFPTTRTVLKVRMKLKTFGLAESQIVADKAGKLHRLPVNGTYSTESKTIWQFEGATSHQQGSAWDIVYTWMRDPGFVFFNTTNNPDLFAPNAFLDPTYTIIPDRTDLPSNPVPLDRDRRTRRPFEQYFKLPAKALVGQPGTLPADQLPGIFILPATNFDSINPNIPINAGDGFYQLPGRPIG